MMTVTKWRRLGGLVLAVGLLAGCGGSADQRDPVLRELETLGLVNDQGSDAFIASLEELYERMADGDADVTDLLV